MFRGRLRRYQWLIRMAWQYGWSFLWDEDFRHRTLRKRKNLKNKQKRITRMGRKGYTLYQNVRYRVKRRILGDRTHGWCMICRELKPRNVLTVDHILPISEGGSHHKSNLQILCQPCHILKDTNWKLNKSNYVNTPFADALVHLQEK